MQCNTFTLVALCSHLAVALLVFLQFLRLFGGLLGGLLLLLGVIKPALDDLNALVVDPVPSPSIGKLSALEVEAHRATWRSGGVRVGWVELIGVCELGAVHGVGWNGARCSELSWDGGGGPLDSPFLTLQSLASLAGLSSPVLTDLPRNVLKKCLNHSEWPAAMITSSSRVNDHSANSSRRCRPVPKSGLLPLLSTQSCMPSGTAPSRSRHSDTPGRGTGF
mmetsp:Transcript_77888/g.223624  ORF Transcript_77888/g.223624 Transcript_77888/m.223624 type:complete len:221 (-) Transcript_77888:839-1501(-)